ncbi:GTP-binding protein [Balamuthia mandrillaris]
MSELRVDTSCLTDLLSDLGNKRLSRGNQRALQRVAKLQQEEEEEEEDGDRKLRELILQQVYDQVRGEWAHTLLRCLEQVTTEEPEEEQAAEERENEKGGTKEACPPSDLPPVAPTPAPPAPSPYLTIITSATTAWEDDPKEKKKKERAMRKSLKESERKEKKERKKLEKQRKKEERKERRKSKKLDSSLVLKASPSVVRKQEAEPSPIPVESTTAASTPWSASAPSSSASASSSSKTSPRTNALLLKERYGKLQTEMMEAIRKIILEAREALQVVHRVEEKEQYEGIVLECQNLSAAYKRLCSAIDTVLKLKTNSSSTNNTTSGVEEEELLEEGTMSSASSRAYTRLRGCRRKLVAVLNDLLMAVHPEAALIDGPLVLATADRASSRRPSLDSSSSSSLLSSATTSTSTTADNPRGEAAPKRKTSRPRRYSGSHLHALKVGKNSAPGSLTSFEPLVDLQRLKATPGSTSSAPELLQFLSDSSPSPSETSPCASPILSPLIPRHNYRQSVQMERLSLSANAKSLTRSSPTSPTTPTTSSTSGSLSDRQQQQATRSPVRVSSSAAGGGAVSPLMRIKAEEGSPRQRPRSVTFEDPTKTTPPESPSPAPQQQQPSSPTESSPPTSGRRQRPHSVGYASRLVVVQPQQQQQPGPSDKDGRDIAGPSQSLKNDLAECGRSVHSLLFQSLNLCKNANLSLNALSDSPTFDVDAFRQTVSSLVKQTREATQFIANETTRTQILQLMKELLRVSLNLISAVNEFHNKQTSKQETMAKDLRQLWLKAFKEFTVAWHSAVLS